MDTPKRTATNGHGSRIKFTPRTEPVVRFDGPAASEEAEGTELPEPIVKPWPAPLEHYALSGLAGEVVRRIEPHTEGDPAAVLAQFLVAFGSSAGRKAYRLAEDDRHYPNLYLVVVGRSSKARKGTTWRRVARLMEEVDPKWRGRHVLTGLASGEGLIDRFKALGAEKRLLAFAAEFSRLLKVKDRENNILSEMLREFWDTGHGENNVRNNPARVSDAHLSLIGHITVAELLSLITSIDAGNGLGNRFLWCCARRTKRLPFGGRPELEALVQPIQSALRRARRQGQMPCTRAADDLWECAYLGRLGDERPGMHGAMTGRGEAQVLRLSLIYALLDGARAIDEAHLRAALAFWDYCDRSALYLFGDGTGNKTADALLGALRAAGDRGLGGTEVNGLFHGHMTRERLAEALGLLKQQGMATDRLLATGGRPQTRWYITGGSGESGKS